MIKSDNSAILQYQVWNEGDKLLSNLSKREKFLIGILLTFLILYVYYYFFLLPVFRNINEVRNNISEDMVQLDKIKNTEAEIKKLTTEYDACKLKFADAARELPESERNPEISLNLKVLGDKNGITLNGITFSNPEGYKSSNQNGTQANNTQKTAAGDIELNVVPVQIDAAGAYPSIMNFVNSIENDSRISRVDGLNITSSDKGLNAAINASYYFTKGIDNNPASYTFNNGTYGKPDIFK